MYAEIGADRVIPLDIPLQSSGVPNPFLLVVNQELILGFRDAGDENWIVVKFRNPRVHFFGSPNDEALKGHPLYGRGLQPYNAGEVHNSSWIKELERRNRIHPLHNSRRFEALRHFIFTFHDSTFECVAENVQLLKGLKSSSQPALINEILSLESDM